MTTTTKKAPAKTASTTAKKQAASTEAAKKSEPTRSDLLTQLADLGWSGPTSYTATILNDVLVPWVAGGMSTDAEGIPAGAMNHAHPKPKAERQPSAAYTKGFNEALINLTVLIKDGATFTEVKKWIDSNKAATA